MTEYPEKTCEIDALVTHKRLVEAAVAGRKTQQRRNGVYGYPGETFTLEGKQFEITGLFRESLGDMTEASAKCEGYPSLEMYNDLIQRMHKGLVIDETSKVWVHEFKLTSE